MSVILVSRILKEAKDAVRQRNQWSKFNDFFRAAEYATKAESYVELIESCLFNTWYSTRPIEDRIAYIKKIIDPKDRTAR